MAGEKPQRINIGFHGGQVLAARVTPEALAALRSALGTEGWHELASEDGAIDVNLGNVVYLLVNQDEPRVGFGL